MIDVSDKEKMILNTDFAGYRVERKRWFDRGVGDRAPLEYYLYAQVFYLKEWRDFSNKVSSGFSGEVMISDGGFKLKREAIDEIERHKKETLDKKKKAAEKIFNNKTTFI